MKYSIKLSRLKIDSLRQNSGVTLLELIVSSVLLVLLLGMGIWALKLLSPEGKMNPETILNIEKNSRKVQLELFGEISEGIEILRPFPGSTTPFLMYVDYLNQVVMLYQKKNDHLSEVNGYDTYDLFRKLIDYSGDNEEELVHRGFSGLSFTAHSPGAVLISGEIAEGNQKFPLVSFTKLSNYENQ